MFSRHRRHLLPLLFISSLICCLWFAQIPTTAQLQLVSTTEAHQLVNKGATQYHTGDYKSAIASWQAALNSYQQNNEVAAAAVVQENLARAYQQVGNNDNAIASWQQVINYYHDTDDLPVMGRMLTEQAQVYSSVGEGKTAIKLLCNEPAVIAKLAANDSLECLPNTALHIARSQGNARDEAAALGSLGEIYRLQGDYQRALAYLQTGLEIAQTTESPAHLTAALNNSIGNAYSGLAQVNYRLANSARQRGSEDTAKKREKAASENDKQALIDLDESYRQALENNNLSGQIKALLNALPIYYRTKNASQAATTKEKILAVLPSLPDSQAKVYAAIDTAKLLESETIAPSECLNQNLQPQAFNLLKLANNIATKLADSRTQSFAWGELAHLYECQRNYQQALQLTQQARLAAEQNMSSPDSLYLWEWQAARIYAKQGQNSQAIKAYESAISTIETIRDDLLIANRDLQFDFRETIEPIYREAIALNLEDIPTAELLPPETNSSELNSILTTANALRLAELQNYFGSDCIIRPLDITRVDLADKNSTTAIFSSIILEGDTAIIVTFPDGSKKVTRLNKTSDALREEIIELRRELEAFRNDFNPRKAQQVYSWLIAPFAQDLQQANINTLVFIQDGILRSVPMGALHDGKQFLIQNYAVATTPSLTLTDPNSFGNQDLRALALGLSEKPSIEGLSLHPLPNVPKELQIVEDKLPGSKPLLNQEFSSDRLQQELNANTYPIIHIATHALFGAVPEDTFLVTGNSEKLTLNQLDKLIRDTPQVSTPIELLSLTACETAIGDERAALGLGGAALQAGARSVLASLWSIEDSKTPEIVESFYTHLQDPNLNKAQALQIAQKELIKQGGQYSHPAYWAPFILIGNWL